MVSGLTREAVSSFRSLTRATRDKDRERCGLCAATVPDEHRHLLDGESSELVCACPACFLLFGFGTGSRLKQVPDQILRRSDLVIGNDDWDAMGIPIGLAFIYRRSQPEQLAVVYPSPGGAMPSLIPTKSWEGLPIGIAAGGLRSDVEGLLVNRIGKSREIFQVPIDVCYRLIGLIRVHWRGLAGGPNVWTRVNEFFEELARRVG